MRPLGRGEMDSLYFNYPKFSAPTSDEHHELTKATPVAIVGAGPVGMTAALSLARHGVRSVLIDKKDTFNDGSRAICVERQSFYILEQIGAVDKFLEKALPWTTGRSFYRGRQILEFQMQDSEDEKYRPMYNIQQQYIEQYLWDAVEASERIDTRWQSAVIGLKDTDDGVILNIEDPGGTYDLKCGWVLAADGARSTVRTLRGQRLRGENHEGTYVIADVQMDHEYPTIRRALFDPDCRRDGTVLIHRQPDNIWRIDYQLRPGEDAESALAEDKVRASVAAVLADLGETGPWALEWWSAYSANTLALNDYRDGRVFFIGDSAHIVPIFGVRGLNNGLADAHNIAWKLAAVLKGNAGERLLNSYTPERRGATLDVFANATKSARFMTPPTRGYTLLRDAALSLALDHTFAGKFANPRQMKPYTYHKSPAIQPDPHGFSNGPSAGSVLPEIKLDTGFLSDHLKDGFNLICFDHTLVKTPAQEGFNTICLPFPSLAAERLDCSRNSAYLIRPDRHIAARWKYATVLNVRDGYRKILNL